MTEEAQEEDALFAEYSAYLMPGASDEYEFQLTGVAWVQFWVDNQVVVLFFSVEG